MVRRKINLQFESKYQTFHFLKVWSLNCPFCPGFHLLTWWRHQFFRVTGSSWEESTVHRWIPLTRPVTRSFDILFDLRMNKRLSKQSRRQWFETPSCSLWHHCKEFPMLHFAYNAYNSVIISIIKNAKYLPTNSKFSTEAVMKHTNGKILIQVPP